MISFKNFKTAALKKKKKKEVKKNQSHTNNRKIGDVFHCPTVSHSNGIPELLFVQCIPQRFYWQCCKPC